MKVTFTVTDCTPEEAGQIAAFVASLSGGAAPAAKPAKAAAEKPAKEKPAKAKKEEAPVEADEPAEPAGPTIEELRAAVMDCSQQVDTKTAVGVLQKVCGVKKVSEVKEADFAKAIEALREAIDLAG